MVTLNAFMVTALLPFTATVMLSVARSIFSWDSASFFLLIIEVVFICLWVVCGYLLTQEKNSVLQALLLAHAGAFTNLLLIEGSWIYWFPITGVELVKIWMDSPVLALMNVGALLPFGLGGVYLNGSDQYYLMSLGMSLLVSILFFGSGAVAARRHPILAASLILGTVLLTGMWLLWILF